MIVLGGNCEPLSAFRRLNVPVFAGPFDWLGVPTAVFPKLIKTDNWWGDIFSLENIVTYPSANHGYIGCRDMKYEVGTPHHFKRFGMMNYKQTIGNQLLKFRENLLNRWLSLKSVLNDSTSHPLVVYREYNPPWTEVPDKDVLSKAYDALIEFAPYGNLVIVTESPPLRTFDKAAVVVQNKMDLDYFRLEDSVWVPVWKLIATEKLEPGKIYSTVGGSVPSLGC